MSDDKLATDWSYWDEYEGSHRTEVELWSSEGDFLRYLDEKEVRSLKDIKKLDSGFESVFDGYIFQESGLCYVKNL